jgi:hemerythrin-like domain-containing protein
MELIIDPLVTRKQVALLKELIEKGYFSTDKAALSYAQNIRDFIYSLPDKAHHKTKDNSQGQYYASYKANKHTTWYVLFDITKDHYQIRNIINNHTPDYPKFIAGLKDK